MQRCLNNRFGYCKGSPTFTPCIKDCVDYDWRGHSFITQCKDVCCDHNELSCGHYLSFTESLAASRIILDVPQPWTGK